MGGCRGGWGWGEGNHLRVFGLRKKHNICDFLLSLLIGVPAKGGGEEDGRGWASFRPNAYNSGKSIWRKQKKFPLVKRAPPSKVQRYSYAYVPLQYWQSNFNILSIVPC